ncbi:hypothetical protein EVAR_33399_1 [Eumeta japonica]|uniref:Uncharacterized protein n=1 Tax=Eumeta variegata TaxID=151549 RepID=A0A4C1W341_EUMVA|nr:hypothetical protein EVAR_33399_1 [Eumeta japonica]
MQLLLLGKRLRVQFGTCNYLRVPAAGRRRDGARRAARGGGERRGSVVAKLIYSLLIFYSAVCSGRYCIRAAVCYAAFAPRPSAALASSFSQLSANMLLREENASTPPFLLTVGSETVQRGTSPSGLLVKRG